MVYICAMKFKNDKVKAWVLLLVLSVIWGSSFILIKKGLLSFSPDEVGSIRIISAAVFLLPISLKNLNKISASNIIWLSSVGFMGSFIPAFLFALAQTRLDSGVTGILNGLTPMFVFIVGVLFFKQLVKREVIWGILLGFLGCFFLITNGSFNVSSFNFYAFFVVLATLCYGINTNIIKFKLEGFRASFITSASMLIVLPIALVYLFVFTDFTTTLNKTPEAWIHLGYIALLGVMSTSLALILFNKLLQLTNPIFTSMVTYIIPVIAVIWGVIDGEKLEWAHLLGFVAIVGGVYLINKNKKATK